MSLDYAKEKFYQMVLGLATGEGTINERLVGAALTLVTRQLERDVPPETVADYKDLIASLTTRPAEIEGEGMIHATIRQMEPHEASKIAERIFDMYFRVLGTRPL